jgi:hypothetical protein
LSAVGVAVDPVNDEIVVANEDNDSITVYPRTASGNVSPLRTIQGPATGLSGAVDVAVSTNPPIPIIPTLDEWGRIGLASLLMVVSAWLTLRRRRST